MQKNTRIKLYTNRRQIFQHQCFSVKTSSQNGLLVRAFLLAPISCSKNFARFPGIGSFPTVNGENPQLLLQSVCLNSEKYHLSVTTFEPTGNSTKISRKFQPFMYNHFVFQDIFTFGKWIGLIHIVNGAEYAESIFNRRQQIWKDTKLTELFLQPTLHVSPLNNITQERKS